MATTVMSDPPEDDEKPVRSRRSPVRRKDALGPEGEIGVRLRTFFGALEQEPIPADLIDLLERLDAAENKGEA